MLLHHYDNDNDNDDNNDDDDDQRSCCCSCLRGVHRDQGLCLDSPLQLPRRPERV